MPEVGPKKNWEYSTKFEGSVILERKTNEKIKIKT
jgi:hypothetical protein